MIWGARKLDGTWVRGADGRIMRFADSSQAFEHGKAEKLRGFAAMSPEVQAAISSKGGKAAHEEGTAHEFQSGSELARAAGRKGGRIVHQKLLEKRRAAAEG